MTDGQRAFDLAVAGGGHAGLLTAVAAARAGFEVALIDPRPLKARQPADGRCLALLGGSKALIERMGVWPQLAPGGVAVRAMLVTEEPSKQRVDYLSTDVGGRDFAYGYENHALRNLLADAALRTPGIRFVQGSVQNLKREGAGPGQTVALDVDGEAETTTLRARLAVGADGRRSKLRELAGIRCEAKDYGQSAVCFAVEHERDHARTGHEWLRPRGPVALLPVAPHRTGVTWVAPRDEAERLAALPETRLLEGLDEIIGSVLGPMRFGSPVIAYPLSVQHAKRYVAPRLALVGDAAHGVHPIHAQGFNMGVGDVAALIGLVEDARAKNRDFGAPEVLLRYERERRPFNAGRVLMTDSMVRVFTGPAPLRTVGRAVLGVIGSIPPLKRRAILHGMQLREG